MDTLQQEVLKQVKSSGPRPEPRLTKPTRDCSMWNSRQQGLSRLSTGTMKPSVCLGKSKGVLHGLEVRTGLASGNLMQGCVAVRKFH